MQSVDEAGHKPAAALRSFSRQGDPVGDDDQATQTGPLRAVRIASSLPPKDLGEHSTANDRVVTSAGAHIRLGTHAKIHKAFYRNRWSRHQAIWALEVGRDAWILSGKIKALPANI
jgi:hypothetical protein